MKRRISIISATVLVCSIALGAALTGIWRQDAPALPPENEEAYFVRAYSGSKIAVFAENRSSPERVINFCIRVLPENDAAALAKGIGVCGADEMRSLIEDITG